MSISRELSSEEIGRHFKAGKEELKLMNFFEAYEEFNILTNTKNLSPEEQSLYSSYKALAQVMLGETNAISQLRESIKSQDANSDLFCNLALAEIKCNKRKNALNAVNRGLIANPNCKRAIAIKKKIDTRRKPIIPFLNRNNSLNILLGKVSYKTSNKGRKSRSSKYGSTLSTFVI